MEDSRPDAALRGLEDLVGLLRRLGHDRGVQRVTGPRPYAHLNDAGGSLLDLRNCRDEAICCGVRTIAR